MRPNPILAFAAATVAAFGLGACSKFGTHGQASHLSKADPSAQLIGTTPAAPSTQEPPGVTPVAKDTTDISKAQQQTGPREGDNHSYSTVAPSSTQKADSGQSRGTQ